MSKFTWLAQQFIISPAAFTGGGLRSIFDAEANGFVADATQVHDIEIGSPDTDQIDSYGPDRIPAALEHLSHADVLIGHNVISYDLPLLRRLYGWAPPAGCRIIDTLIASRLILQNIAALDDQAAAMGDPKLGELRGSHSAEAWGVRLGIPKVGADIEDFSQWSPELQARCIGDVILTKKLFQFLKPDGCSQEALELEHRVAPICDRIRAEGVPFDRAAAEVLRECWTKRSDELVVQFGEHFPDTNINSRVQIGALLEARSWIPERRTKTGRPELKNETLETIGEIYPEFADLAEYYILKNLLGKLSDGDKSWCNFYNAAEGRIHGNIWSIGTPHFRASHSDPNLAGVPNPKKGGRFGGECRALFRAPEGWAFVTADQASLQDRGLGHYLYDLDGGAYARDFLAGVDSHWRNAGAIGFVAEGTARDKENKAHTAAREAGKRLRYASLYGSGKPRAGRIVLECVRLIQRINGDNLLSQKFFGSTATPNDAVLTRVGKQVLNRFEDATPGLHEPRASRKLYRTRQIPDRLGRATRTIARAAHGFELRHHVERSDHLQALALQRVRRTMHSFPLRLGWRLRHRAVGARRDRRVLPTGDRRGSWQGLGTLGQGSRRALQVQGAARR